MTGFNNGSIFVPVGGGCGVSDYITEYAARAVWNQVASRFQFVGTPHGSSCSNSTRFVVYDEATNTWFLGPQTNSAATAHAYEHNAITPAGTHYYRQYDSYTVYVNPNGGTTSPWNTIAPIGASSKNCCGTLEWFPDMNRLIFIDEQWGGWAWNPGNNSWTHLFRTDTDDGSGLPQYILKQGTSYYNWAHYSSTGVFLFGHGTNVYKMNAAGAVKQLATPPFAIDSANPNACCSVTTDPTSGRLIVINTSRQVYDLDPGGTDMSNAGTWINTGRTAPTFFTTAGGIGESLIAAPMRGRDAIIYVKCDDSSQCRVYVYQHVPGTPDTVAPTAPTNFAAKTATSTQIDLSWTASTDDRGTIQSYLVERCSGAACINFVQIAVVSGSATSYSNTGLTGGTLYRYRIRATDSAGNISGYSSIAQDTTSAPDTTAPTNPSSLAATAAAADQINLTWTASSDAVGVTGYHVERCQNAGCANFVEVGTTAGAVTTYSSTGLTAATSYSFRVRANDAANNLSGYSNTDTAVTLAGGTDFASRCAAPGVVRCVGFETGDGSFFTGTGGFNGAYSYNMGVKPRNNTTDYSHIGQDNTVAASGASSLRMEVASGTGADPSGTWFTNFSNPASGFQVGPGQEFYIQWRQRFSPEMIAPANGGTFGNFWGFLNGQQILTLSSTAVGTATATLNGSSNTSFSGMTGRHIYFDLGRHPAGSTGEATIASVQSPTQATINITTAFNASVYQVATWGNDFGKATFKLSDISAGDTASCTPGNPTSATCPTTCWDFEVVTTNHARADMPTGYANCNAPGGINNAGFYGPQDQYQNIVNCPYNAPGPTFPPCFPLVPNEWLTFQVHVYVNQWNTANSTYQMWAAREGQPSQLIIECSPAVTNCRLPHTGGAYLFSTNTNYKFGKIWFETYMTDRSSRQSHSTGYVWFDDLIISTNKIADPGTVIIPPILPGGTTMQGVTLNGQIVIQ